MIGRNQKMTTGKKSDNVTISDEVRDVDAANPFRQIDSGTNLSTVTNAASDNIGMGSPTAAPPMTGPQNSNGLAGQ
jgi:hypothetical protein